MTSSSLCSNLVDEEGLMINRVGYQNRGKQIDFEIVDLQHFFSTRPHRMLEKDVRMDFWILMVVTAGEGYHSIDFERYPYGPGDVVFISRNQVHHFEINTEVEGYLIHINEPFLYAIDGFDGTMFLSILDSSFDSPVIPLDLAEGSTNRVLLDLLDKEYRKSGEVLNLELIASLFQSLILSFRSEHDEPDPIMDSSSYTHYRRFKGLVEDHYREHLSVKEYAELMGVSTKTVNQVTRKIAGLSAKQFITDRLILEIKRYISQGELLNYEIADLLGFDEAANMTGFFSRNVGISPREFRKRL